MRAILVSFLISTFSVHSFAQDWDLSPLVNAIRASFCGQVLAPGSSVQTPPLLVVGLGNSGSGYEGTRHNAGEMLLGALERGVTEAKILSAPDHWMSFRAQSEEEAAKYVDFSGASSPRKEGLVVHYRVGGQVSIPPSGSQYSGMIFVRPLYDINESGVFLAALTKALNFNPQQILVIVDDLSIDRNKIVLSIGKADGRGDAHNGLKSINQELGTGEYARLRVGVSNPKAEGQDISRVDWVLGPIPEEDQNRLLSGARAKALFQLIQNQRQRLVPDAHQQKLAAEVAQNLKDLNSN